MIESICKFIADLFNENVVLATILVSMIPLFELKVGIPFGMNSDFWAVPLSSWGALSSALAGGLIVTIILALAFKPLYEKIKDKKFFVSFVNFFTSSAMKKSDAVESKAKEKNVSNKKKLWLKLLAVFAFVAIPVPGTGVYTGTVLAIFLGLDFWKTIISVTLGNVVAGLIIMFICSIFPEITTILIYVFVILILVYLAYRLIVHFINKKRNKKEDIVEVK